MTDEQQRVLRAISDEPRELTIEEIMRVSGERCDQWNQGETWTPSMWITAVVGELGEMANFTKKLFRKRAGQVGCSASIEELEHAEEDEWADTVHYLILFARDRGMNPSAALRRVFNRKSEELGFEQRL